MRCEVTNKISLIVDKGSIVEVDDRQYELARQFLKPIVAKVQSEKVEPKATKKQKK